MMRSHLWKIALLLALSLTLVTVAAQAQPAAQQKPPAQDQAQQPAEPPPHVDQQTNPDDRKLEQAIMGDLRKDPHMAFSRVTVHVSDTEVVLTGIVLTQTAKDQAEQIAGQHAQGRKMNNRIRVNPNLNPGPGF